MSTEEPKTPEVKKPLSELSKSERKKRYKEFQTKLGRSKLTVVGGDPNRHYFWGPKDDDGELVRLDGLEYRVEKCPEPKEVMAGKKKPPLQAAGLREDGTWCIGDVILMSCPLEVYEFHLLDVEERSEAQISASVENFKITAEQQGIPTFSPAIR